jgi:hypothetical protein
MHESPLSTRDYMVLLLLLLLLFNCIGLTPGGSSIHLHRIQRTEHTKQLQGKNNNFEEKIGEQIGKCGPCPVFASYTLAFALQLRKKHGETLVRVVEKCPDIPVAAVQYTSTHRQCTERNIRVHNNKNT